MQVLKIGFSLVCVSFLAACQPAAPIENSIKNDAKYATPTGYNRAFSPELHNYQRAFADQGQPVRFGTSSQRFEIREGDCDITDCSKPRARAEIQQNQDAIKAEIGKDIWYAWSFYNQSVPSFTKQNSLRLVFGQWTLGGTRPSIFRLMQMGQGEANFSNCDPKVCSNIVPVQGDVVLQLDDIAKTYKWGASQNNGNICRLFDMKAQQGRWVDLTVNTNFSTSDDGYLRVWVNQELVCSYSGPIVSQASVFERGARKPEHRRGIFSTWTKRWKTATGGAAIPNLVVYYDGFRRGNSYAEVNAPFNQDQQAEPFSSSLAPNLENPATKIVAADKVDAFMKSMGQSFIKAAINGL